MPQEKRRTISYRSFVTCDDPKGVECGAIRKSKSNNSEKKEQDYSNKIEYDRKQKNNNANTSVLEQQVAAVIKEESDKKKEIGIRGITRERLETPVPFQLLEVSKNAGNLNHVIDSWGNDKFSKDYIAKDLLRGALDLQESLVMLGKLQEASSYMIGLARKQKQKLEEGTFDGMVSDVRGFQRSPVGLVDECPRKSVDGMRNAVRDSLLRQSVITNPIFEEHCDHRRMASPDMMPSTSSSQSSRVRSSNFVPSDSSVSSPASLRKKGKNSNVIVKLMGLESFPSSPRKHLEREKILNMEKPMYEIDSPRAKRPSFGDQEGGMKQRSVEEILENLKFKGLLRSNSGNDLASVSLESEDFSFDNCWVDERTPVVLMKPLRYPCIDLDKPFLCKPQEEMGMKPRYSRVSSQKIFSNESVKYSEKFQMQGKEVDCDEKAKSMKKVASPKPKKKQAEVKRPTEVEKVASIRRKGDEKKGAKSSDQLSSRDQEKLTTAKIRNKNGKPTSKIPTSSQQKTASSPGLDHRNRGTSERKNKRLATLILEEKQICKDEIHENMDSKAVSSENVDRKDDNNFIFATVNSRIGDTNDKERCQSQIRDYDIDSESKLLETPKEIINSPSNKSISHYDDSQSSYSEITSVSAGECCNVDQFDETVSPIHEVTLITTHENGVAVNHDINQEESNSPENGKGSSEKTDNVTALRQSHTPRTKLKALLLGNQLFVNHIEDLFNIQVNPVLAPNEVDDSDQDLERARVLIDCANEALKIKSLQFSLACLPLPRVYTAKSRSLFSLDRLLDEVCNEIEDLRCYERPFNDEDLPSDNLYALIDQDLRFKSETWGVGWRHMYTQDEIEQVIGEVDKSVLTKLIEEVLSDFML